jgi:hypothetical protein
LEIITSHYRQIKVLLFGIILSVVVAIPLPLFASSDLAAKQNELNGYYAEAQKNIDKKQFQKAIDNCEKSLKAINEFITLAPQFKNNIQIKNLKETVYIWQGEAYRFLTATNENKKNDNFENSFVYYWKAIENDSLGQKDNILIFIGELFDGMGNWHRDNSNYEKAFKYYNFALKVTKGDSFTINMRELIGPRSKTKNESIIPSISKQKLVTLQDKKVHEKSNITYTLMRLGKFRDAIKSYVSLNRKGTHGGNDNLNLGKCYYLLGLFGEAELAFSKAQDFYKSSDDKAGSEKVRINRGLLMIDQGLYEDAADEFELVYNDTKDTYNKIISANNLGNVYFYKFKESYKNKFFENAEHYFKNAIKQAEESMIFPKAEKQSHFANLGSLYHEKAKSLQYESDRIKFIDKAKEKYKSIEEDSLKALGLSTHYANRGDLLLFEIKSIELNQNEKNIKIIEALELYKKSLSEAQALEISEQLYIAFYGLGKGYNARYDFMGKSESDFSSAVENYKKSIEEIEQMRDLLPKADGMGFLRNKQKVYTDFIDLLLNRWGDEKDKKEKEKYSTQALSYLERSRLAAIKNLFYGAAPEGKKKYNEDLIEIDKRLNEKRSRRLELKTSKSQLHTLNSEIKKLEESKQEISKKRENGDVLIKKPEFTKGTFEFIKKAISPNQVVLEFYYNKKNIYIWKFDKKLELPELTVLNRMYFDEGYDEDVDIIDNISNIHRIMVKYIDTTTPKPPKIQKFFIPTDPEYIGKTGTLIYQSLFKDIQLEPYNILSIIPFGKLSLLPFSVLKNDKGRILDNFICNYYFSLKQLLLPIKTITEDSLFAVGNPEIPLFISKAGYNNPSKTRSFNIGDSVNVNLENSGFEEAEKILKRLSSRDSLKIKNEENGNTTRGVSQEEDLSYYSQLPNAGSEVNSIAELFKKKQKKAKKYAKDDSELKVSEKIVKKEMGGDYSYFHFATHGKLMTGDPLNSFLVFSEDPDKSKNNSGLLRVKEIREEFTNKLSDVKLVVLSACQTSLAFSSSDPDGATQGLELASLAGAFQSAGVHSVIASLWEVNSATTEKLMKRFYTYLLEEKSIGEALQLAKKDLTYPNCKIEDETCDKEPYWAPFILLGAPD